MPESREQEGEEGEKSTRSQGKGLPAALPLAGLVIGAWSLLPPYSGPALDTETRVEIADHIVPGVLVLAPYSALLGGQAPPREGRIDGMARASRMACWAGVRGSAISSRPPVVRAGAMAWRVSASMSP